MNDEKAMYYMKKPGEFLNTTGLIFELNRQVLNPFGLAITVGLDDDDVNGVFRIIDAREDKEGVVYDPESFIKGMEKMNEFMESFGINKLEERRDELGFVVQEQPDALMKKNGVILVTYNPEYEEDETNTIIFRVPFDWLEKKTWEWFEWGADTFLTEYTYDHSEIIYDLAKRENVLMQEKSVYDGMQGEG